MYKILTKVALIVLALAAVVTANSYGHGGYGGYKTDYYVSLFIIEYIFSLQEI